MKKYAGASDYVFPSADGKAPGDPKLITRSVARNLKRLQAAAAKQDPPVTLEPFTVHDLRRTMRSQLSALGVPFAVAERCLNHRLPGQGEIYDRHDFLEQRRHALVEWADVLDVLSDEGVKAARERITSAQVIPLRRSA